MLDIKDKLEDVVDHVEGITKTYINLSMLKAVDKGSKLGATLVVTLLMFGVAFFTLFFALFGLAIWIGRELQNSMLGFFIVAGGLLLILILLLVLNRSVIMPFIRNTIIRILYDDKD